MIEIFTDARVSYNVDLCVVVDELWPVCWYLSVGSILDEGDRRGEVQSGADSASSNDRQTLSFKHASS